MEAVLEDERLENFDNAETGKLLAKYVHTKTHDNRTGSGPCQLSDNLQYFNCPQPLPQQWADLYSTWNLAFTTGFPDFVYYMPKLLIPSVGAYQNDTGSYIYPRIFALYRVSSKTVYTWFLPFFSSKSNPILTSRVSFEN